MVSVMDQNPIHIIFLIFTEKMLMVLLVMVLLSIAVFLVKILFKNLFTKVSPASYTTNKNVAEDCLTPPISIGIQAVDKMNGKQFEKFLAMLFVKSGYQVTLTPEFGDYGADLILEKNGERIAVQAKRWKSKINPRAVQEIVAAIRHYNANKGIVVTNGHYTKYAKELAADNKVELFGRKELSILISEHKAEDLATEFLNNKREISDPPAIKIMKTVCLFCGADMVVRKSKNGSKFWGCSKYPKCRFTHDYLDD